MYFLISWSIVGLLSFLLFSNLEGGLKNMKDIFALVLISGPIVWLITLIVLNSEK